MKKTTVALETNGAAATTANASSPLSTNNSSSNELSLRQHVISQYKQSITASPQQAEHLRKIAYDYLKLKNDLAERGRLHELDAGADTQLSGMELSRRAAARAGLQLPKLDVPRDENTN